MITKVYHLLRLLDDLPGVVGGFGDGVIRKCELFSCIWVFPPKGNKDEVKLSPFKT